MNLHTFNNISLSVSESTYAPTRRVTYGGDEPYECHAPEAGFHRDLYTLTGTIRDGVFKAITPELPPAAPEPEFYMLFVEGALTPRVKHTDRKSARDEAERLARLLSGKKVYVLAAVSTCEAAQAPIAWTPERPA